MDAGGRCWSVPGEYSIDWVMSSRQILALDPMGRITQEQRCIPGSCTTSNPGMFNYSYDLAGNVIAANDGKGQAQWSPRYDKAGRLSLVTSITALPGYSSTQLFWAGAPNSYAPFGGLLYWTQGDPSSTTGQSPLSGSRSYDVRLRPSAESVVRHE